MMKLLNNQTLIDLSIQESGTAENWLLMAMENDLVPTEKLEVGTKINLPEFESVDTDVVRYLAINKVQPATANQNEALVPGPVLSCQEELENCFK